MARLHRLHKKNPATVNQRWLAKHGKGEAPDQAQMMEQLSAGLKRLGYPTYQAYLASPWWVDVKRRWYAAHQSALHCARCGAFPFDLHHRTYKRLGLEQLTDLIALCRACHSSEHDKLRHLYQVNS